MSIVQRHIGKQARQKQGMSGPWIKVRRFHTGVNAYGPVPVPDRSGVISTRSFACMSALQCAPLIFADVIVDVTGIHLYTARKSSGEAEG